MTNPTIISPMTKPKPHVRDYMLAKSTDEDPVRTKSIPVYSSLHEHMVDIARSQNLPIYEIYAQASRSYLQNLNYFIPQIGDVTADEKTFIEEALHLYRNRNSNKVFGEVVSVIQTMIRLATRTKV